MGGNLRQQQPHAVDVSWTVACVLIFVVFSATGFFEKNAHLKKCIERGGKAAWTILCTHVRSDRTMLSIYIARSVFAACAPMPRGWKWWGASSSFSFVFDLLGSQFLGSDSEDSWSIPKIAHRVKLCFIANRRFQSRGAAFLPPAPLISMLMQRQAMASPRIHATPGGPIGNNIEIGGAGGAVVKKSGWAFFSKDPGTNKNRIEIPKWLQDLCHSHT